MNSLIDVGMSVAERSEGVSVELLGEVGGLRRAFKPEENMWADG